MKRDEFKEIKIIRNISKEVKLMYIKEKLNNIGNQFTYFKLYILQPIEEGNYSFLGREGIMKDFNEYVCQFGHSEKEEKTRKNVIQLFLKLIEIELDIFKEEIKEGLFQKLKVTYPEIVNEYGKELLEKLEK